MSYKDTVEFEHRHNESRKIIKKYPNRIPVICEKATSSRAKMDDIDKNKFLVPSDLTVGQFSYVIRKRLKLRPEDAIFILVNNTFPSSSTEIRTLYDEYRDDDGFLYLKYCGEPTFGGF